MEKRKVRTTISASTGEVEGKRALATAACVAARNLINSGQDEKLVKHLLGHELRHGFAVPERRTGSIRFRISEFESDPKSGVVNFQARGEYRPDFTSEEEPELAIKVGTAVGKKNMSKQDWSNVIQAIRSLPRRR